MMGSIAQQPTVGNERLSECVVNIYRKLSRPEFQQEILDLPENVAAKKQHWKEYKAKRWRTRVRYFGRYIAADWYVAADSRWRDPEYAKLSSTHQFVSLTRKLEIRDEDEVWIVVGPLRDYLTKRFEYFRGNTYVYLDLEISGWIPNRLTEEQDDKSFYLPFSHWSGGEDDRGNKYKYNRLEKLTTLVLVWESLGIGFDLSPSGPLTNEVGMSFAYHTYKIRDLANDNKIDVPILELWLDSLDPDTSQGGDEDVTGGPKMKKIKPTPETLEIIRLHQANKTIDDIVAETGTSAPNARTVGTRLKNEAYEI